MLNLSCRSSIVLLLCDLLQYELFVLDLDFVIQRPASCYIFLLTEVKNKYELLNPLILIDLKFFDL